MVSSSTYESTGTFSGGNGSGSGGTNSPSSAPESPMMTGSVLEAARSAKAAELPAKQELD